jgi:16S rRNA (uracil1498-N3)-methyltransferase
VKPNVDVTILIGPEGDFQKKITLALENEFVAVTLGTTRLRTETAAIVACHSVVFINEEE